MCNSPGAFPTLVETRYKDHWKMAVHLHYCCIHMNVCLLYVGAINFLDFQKLVYHYSSRLQME